MQFVDAVIREKRQSVKDSGQLHISSDNRSSTPDWLQNFQTSQQMSNGLETGPSVSSRPDRAVPSFMRTAAVPPPPSNVEHLHLSQMFQASCSSSQTQPATDSAYQDFSDNNAERSELDDFVSQSKERNSTDCGHLQLSQAATFKVPYKTPSKPIAKVSRQETGSAASNWQLDSRQMTRAGNQNFQKTSQNPPMPEGRPNSSTIAKAQCIQTGFSGVPASEAMTPFRQDITITSSTSQHNHVGDTPLALSGMQTKIIWHYTQFRITFFIRIFLIMAVLLLHVTSGGSSCGALGHVPDCPPPRLPSSNC